MKWARKYLLPTKVTMISTAVLVSSLFFMKSMDPKNISSNKPLQALNIVTKESTPDTLYFHLPVREGFFRSRFSKRRFHPVEKKFKPHNGVDIGRRNYNFWNEPIVAASDGIVELVKKRGIKAGAHIEIRSNDSIVTRYLHLNRKRLLVKEGDHVNSGDTIAYMGESGNAVGLHLHFEIEKKFIRSYHKRVSRKEKYLNPQNYVIELRGKKEGDYLIRDDEISEKHKYLFSDSKENFIMKSSRYITNLFNKKIDTSQFEKILALQEKKDSLETILFQIQNQKEHLKSSKHSLTTKTVYMLQIAGSYSDLSPRQVRRLENKFHQKIYLVKVGKVRKYSIGNYHSKNQAIHVKDSLIHINKIKSAGIIKLKNNIYQRTEW